MRKNILLASIILTLQSCDHAGEKNTKEDVQIISDTCHESLSLSFKNPALIFGSDFLNIFKRFYINQDYNSMLLFTSNETKIKFGQENILEFYKKESNLGFAIKLKALQYNHDSTMCILSYEADIYATKRIKTIKCRIENDSTKILLSNLQSIFQ